MDLKRTWADEYLRLDLARKIEAYTGQEKTRSSLATQVEAIRTRWKELQERYDTFLGPHIAEAIDATQGKTRNPRFPRRATPEDVSVEGDSDATVFVSANEPGLELRGTDSLRAH